MLPHRAGNHHVSARLRRRHVSFESINDPVLDAAAIDAFAVEPSTDDELLNPPNFIATPHIGAGVEEARWRTGVTAIEGLTDDFVPEPAVYRFEDTRKR